MLEARTEEQQTVPDSPNSPTS